jgi:hypothetical protein
MVGKRKRGREASEASRKKREMAQDPDAKKSNAPLSKSANPEVIIIDD